MAPHFVEDRWKREFPMPSLVSLDDQTANRRFRVKNAVSVIYHHFEIKKPWIVKNQIGFSSFFMIRRNDENPLPIESVLGFFFLTVR